MKKEARVVLREIWTALILSKLLLLGAVMVGVPWTSWNRERVDLYVAIFTASIIVEAGGIGRAMSKASSQRAGRVSIEK